MIGTSPRIRPKRRALDRIGRSLAFFGGLVIFAAVVTLTGFIVKETLPLLRDAEVTPRTDVRFREAGVPVAGGPVLAAGVDEYMEKAFLLRSDGSFDVIDLGTGKATSSVSSPLSSGVRIAVAEHFPGESRVVFGTADGRVGTFHTEFSIDFVGAERQIAFAVEAGEMFRLDPLGRPLRAAAVAGAGARVAAAGITEGDGAVLLLTREAARSMFGGGQATTHTFDLSDAIGGRATALALSPDGDELIVGDDRGLLYHWNLNDQAEPRLVAVAAANGPHAGAINGAAGESAVTALKFLLGGETVVVGDAAGGVAGWFQVPDAGSGTGRRFRPIHAFEPHSAPVLDIAASPRNRTFLTVDEEGVIKMRHSTSEQTLYSMRAGSDVGGAAITPKSDGQLVLTSDGLTLWNVDDPHPEVNLRTLFLPVHYEGHPKPDLVWQSTGGSDAFEPKFGLTPLAFGTIKGTIYALLFALPLGILGAIYTSQFMNPRLQSVVKPVVEIMAGLPSVVLGFLAALWLAPVMTRVFPALVVMALILPLLIVLVAFGWRKIPPAVKRGIPNGIEGVLLVPVILAAGAISLAFGPSLEAWVMAGDFRLWLFDVAALPYEQRNSLVIGIVMGFAVIPVVFSISEDALSSVPRSLSAGSLALGASRWQTVLGVVVPAALPGIVSSVMVGIGRAVGETMIVLMATGNTPVMNMNIFEGFRALSATIAVELPEAPAGGTLYRVLFVAALLLFVFTFLLNTVGEVVRMRMRKRLNRL